MDLIVCAFPGTGKSTAYADHTFLPDYERMSRTEMDEVPTQSKILYDSDSSNFPKERFPENYLEHIQACRGRSADVVQLVSTHDTVTAGLAALNILHIIVYPRVGDKDLYLARYRERGSPEAFITLMDQKWDDFMVSVREAAEHPLAHGIELHPDQYVADVVTQFVQSIGHMRKTLNQSVTGKFDPTLGRLKLDEPLMPDYPLGKAYPYSHEAYRTVMVELITKFRLTDKKIQRGTGINRVRLNKMYTSANSYIAKGEWEALLTFAKTLNCYPFGPKRSAPVTVTTPMAITAVPNTEPEGDRITHLAKSAFSTAVARAARKVAEIESGRIADSNPSVMTGLDMIHPGAYDFEFSEDGTRMTYRVPTSDVKPTDIVENLGQFFDRRDVQMATSENHFEGDTFNTLPDGVDLEKPPALSTDSSGVFDRSVTFSGEVRINDQTAQSATDIGATLGLVPPQASDDPIRR